MFNVWCVIILDDWRITNISTRKTLTCINTAHHTSKEYYTALGQLMFNNSALQTGMVLKYVAKLMKCKVSHQVYKTNSSSAMIND